MGDKFFSNFMLSQEININCFFHFAKKNFALFLKNLRKNLLR